MISPSTRSAKYSGGPKRSAKVASGGARSITAIRPSVPATKEPNAATPSAAPARPRRAIWYPSRHVTTDAASPGMFSRMDVVDPPYIAP